ncbi:MAG TPA: large conductance mechanosensitive channel protein MscL [Mycobacteriales bacterium]|nr:large conductance mechanosensitive channel protein MscL [Mycobacteriales bacterium]
MLKGFRDFLLRGNVIELAVAVAIGTAFTAVVTQFGKSFVEPLVGLVGGGGQKGGTFTVNGQTFAWGAFVNAIIFFVLTAAIIYFVVVAPFNALNERRKRGQVPPDVPPTQEELLTEIRDLLRAQNQSRP